MRFNQVLPIIFFFPVLLFQITIIPLISINGIIPDLLLILLVYYSISYGQIYGTVLGAAYGFLFDLITGSLLGSMMLSKTVVGFVAGYYSAETHREKFLNTYAFTFIILLCAVIDSVIYSFFSAVDFNTNIFKLFFDQALLPALYTGVVSTIIIFFPYRRNFN
jgi:rod shape-determining protein MreD